MLSNFLKLNICVALAMQILGCSEALLANNSDLRVTEIAENELSNEGDASSVELNQIPLEKILGDDLMSWADRFDRYAVERSAAVQDYTAAQADYLAVQFNRYPQIMPTASAPLDGDGEISIGLNIYQTLWDAGRTSAQLSSADHSIEKALVRAWAARNQAIGEGLLALVNFTRFEARLHQLTHLQTKLEVIEELIQVRVEGGVADRGEILRVGVAQQEIHRQILSDRAAQRQAKADLEQRLPYGSEIQVPPLNAISKQCYRDWPEQEFISDALARIEEQQVASDEQLTRAQLFPRLLLTGETINSGSGWSKPSLGLRVDASDMLGLGRRGSLEASAARTRAANVSYSMQQEQSRAEILKQDNEFKGLELDFASLRILSEETRSAIDLYDEQLDAASISLTDGIALYREYTDTRLSLINVEADMLLNCLRSAEFRGLLAPIDIGKYVND